MKWLTLILLILILPVIILPVTAATLSVRSDYDARVVQETDGLWPAMSRAAPTDCQTLQDKVYIYPISHASTSNQYTSNWRGILTWDTSALPDGATISGATVNVYGATKDNALGTVNFSMCDCVPGSSSSFVTSDYNCTSFTRSATDIPYASFTESGWNEFTLNSAGLANVSKTGNTTFMFMIDKDVDYSSLTWSADSASGFELYNAKHGANYRAYLNITYTTEVTPVASFTQTKVVNRIPGAVSFTDTSTNTPTYWNWSFGDGSVNTTTQNATKRYTRPGKFTVTLWAGNGAGQDDQTSTVWVVQGGYMTSPFRQNPISCEYGTYTTNREIEPQERLMTEKKLAGVCYG